MSSGPPDLNRWFTEADLTDCPACGERRAVHHDGAPLYCLECTEVFTHPHETGPGGTSA